MKFVCEAISGSGSDLSQLQEKTEDFSGLFLVPSIFNSFTHAMNTHVYEQ